jgi:hypothetical protein
MESDHEPLVVDEVSMESDDEPPVVDEVVPPSGLDAAESFNAEAEIAAGVSGQVFWTAFGCGGHGAGERYEMTDQELGRLGKGPMAGRYRGILQGGGRGQVNQGKGRGNVQGFGQGKDNQGRGRGVVQGVIQGFGRGQVNQGRGNVQGSGRGEGFGRGGGASASSSSSSSGAQGRPAQR